MKKRRFLKYFFVFVALIFFISIFVILYILSKEFVYYKANLKNKKTITFEEYLHTDEKPWYILTTNNDGNVIYRGKTVLSESNKEKPLNDDTAYDYIEIKTLILAKNIKPKKGCNPKEPYKNGIYGLGCYMQFPEDKD